MPEETRRKIGAALRGRSLSESTKMKLSMTKKGRPRPNQRGPAHGMWKGDAVGLTALHDWIHLRLPRPEACQKCGVAGKPIDLHNIDKKYTRDLSQWIYLCKKCHAKEEAPARAKCHTPEARAKRGNALRGRKRPPEVGLKISAAKTKPRRIVECACGCGTLITTPGRWGEVRFVHGHNLKTDAAWRKR